MQEYHASMNHHEQHARRSVDAHPTPTRRTIGLLCDAPVHQYSSNMWAGVRDAARASGTNLLYFAGGIPGHYYHHPNVLYDRISPSSFDGLVIWSAQLSQVVGSEAIMEFCRRLGSRPIVSIGLELQGFPCILVDNYQGIYDAVTHLITTHGFRRIGYVHPWFKNIESTDRYRGYCDALKDYDIPFDAQLVTDGTGPTLPEYHEASEHGRLGARVLFEQRGLRPTADIEAVVAGDDRTAIDVANFLQSRGFRIPEDLAIVGFDDIKEAQIYSPPVTTARQSFYDQGRQAVDMLMATLRGAAVTTPVKISPPLIIRRSCGCLNPLVSQAKTAQNSLTPQSRTSETDTAWIHERDAILTAMAQALHEQNNGLPPEWPALVFESFLADVRQADHSSATFITTLEGLLIQALEAGSDLKLWHNVVSALRRHVRPSLTDADLLGRAEDLWHQARVVIGEIAERARAVQAMSAVQLLSALQATGQALITTFDLPQLMDFLAQELPRLGIPSGYVALYDEEQNPAGQAHLILAYNTMGRIDLNASASRIQPRHVLPENMLPQNELQSLVILALYFQEHHIGFVAFEAGECEGLVYEVLRREISTALYGALLVQRVQEHSDELTRQKYLLDAFIENAPARIYFKNRDGQIIRANKAHAIRYGFDDPAEELGKTDFDLLPPETARRIARKEQQLLEADRPLLNYENMATLPDGQEIWSLITKMPLHDEHGDIIGTFGISIDITQLKQTEHALERARQSAEEARQAAEIANQAKSEFLANISHELRTPLNAMLGYTQFLQRERNPSADTLAEGLGIIQRSGEHLLTLINDILDLSKIEARKMELHAIPVKLPALLNEIVGMIRMRADAKGIRVSDEFDPDLPEGVLVDETRLRQVLLNLLANAVKFAPSGTVIFRVKKLETGDSIVRKIPLPLLPDPMSPEASLQSPVSVLFEIEDTGIGISEQDLQRIFLPFEQIDDTGIQFSGTGLGLTISQRIVDLMGGTLRVTSTVGVGSTFSIEIVVPEVQLATLHASYRQRTIQGYRGPRQTVLIVDDHLYNRQILRKTLETIGFLCIEAEHGEQGLALAHAHSPCLMLVDLVMPIMDGITFARKVRENPEWAEMVLVAVSANAFEHQIATCRQAGYNAFLAKPFNIQEVFHLLETHLLLDWIYDISTEDESRGHPEHSSDSDQPSMVQPPQDILHILYTLAQKGDLFGLRAQLDTLSLQHREYAAFFDKVRYFADQYQDLELLTFLEHALTTQEPTSPASESCSA